MVIRAGHLKIALDYWKSSEQLGSVLEPVVQRRPLGLARLQVKVGEEPANSADSGLQPAEQGYSGHLIR